VQQQVALRPARGGQFPSRDFDQLVAVINVARSSLVFGSKALIQQA
jgi:hypothetical protein